MLPMITIAFVKIVFNKEGTGVCRPVVGRARRFARPLCLNHSCLFCGLEPPDSMCSAPAADTCKSSLVGSWASWGTRLFGREWKEEGRCAHGPEVCRDIFGGANIVAVVATAVAPTPLVRLTRETGPLEPSACASLPMEVCKRDHHTRGDRVQPARLQRLRRHQRNDRHMAMGHRHCSSGANRRGEDVDRRWAGARSSSLETPGACPQVTHPARRRGRRGCRAEGSPDGWPAPGPRGPAGPAVAGQVCGHPGTSGSAPPGTARPHRRA